MNKTKINLDILLPEVPDEKDACVTNTNLKPGTTSTAELGRTNKLTSSKRNVYLFLLPVSVVYDSNMIRKFSVNVRSVTV
mgnify:FL=1